MALAAGLGELDEDVGRRLGQGMDLGLLAGIGLGAHGRAQAAGVDEDAVRAAIRDELSEHYDPERFTYVDDLPRTTVGKIDKKAVRAWLAAGGAR